MAALPWKPWHEVVRLREDLRSGQLPLALFAADIYDVMMRTGKRPQYEDPREFFALTYPTRNLRDLARDVMRRLAGQSDKAVRQLELTYGGGKTHTLITLYHLASGAEHLPDLPAVHEFTSHIGIPLPRACVAVLPFDKLDVESGMNVCGPTGDVRRLKQPWSVLAFQIAGADGLRLLHAEGADAERQSAPAENLLTELLELPGKQGLSTLVLIDEVLMYAREKVGLDPVWRDRLVDFFQYLTQAAVRVDHCAIVASLLATEPRKSDSLGKEITRDLYAIFRRQLEEGVEPVVKEDVAELLRRRFFTSESTRDQQAFRPHVLAALAGVGELDEQTQKGQSREEERFLSSYPFHPDLTEVLYSKWTNLEGFQRTRGVLRTFALALRDAESWDESPLVGVNVFLARPQQAGLSDAARELTTIAATEDYDGKRQDWNAILQGELDKGREIQRQSGALHHREVEQAVFATFLHSQPIGQKALTRELLVLLGHTHPDKIELEKALLRWKQVSWFLDDADAGSGGTSNDNGVRVLPRSWRLGSKPNLVQMHDDAMAHVTPELLDARMVSEIGKLKNLTAGVSGPGVRVHTLPERSGDIEDNGEFHYAVLGPSAASEPGQPGSRARQFLEETTSSDRPRVYRNAVLLVAPSKGGLEAARNAIRGYLAWEEVSAQLGKQEQVDPLRAQLLAIYLDESKKAIPVAIRQAYCIVVTVGSKNEVQAFRVTVGSELLFSIIKADPRSRIQETAINAEALLPGGPYDLWREGDTARRVKDLVGAFAQLPHLPKMLNSKAILETLVNGCEQGLFVLCLQRPDHSVRTFWRQRPDEVALKEPALELVLPEAATLTELSASLLLPGTLPGLWLEPQLTVTQLRHYFSGKRVVKLQREGYEEPIPIPGADAAVVTGAIRTAVKEKQLWLTTGQVSILGEEIPPGVLTDESVLQKPPQPLSPMSILPQAMPAAWEGGTTTTLAIALALSNQAGRPLPWLTVHDAIDGAFRAHLLERTLDSGPWPCDYGGAGQVKLRVPSAPPPPPPPPPGRPVAESELTVAQLQDVAEGIGDLVKAAAGTPLKLTLRIELGGGTTPSAHVVERLNELLAKVSGELRLR